MAADVNQMVLIGTPQRVYGISPGDRNHFLRTFQAQTELGSLSPISAYSAYPSFLMAEIWRSPMARVFLVLSLVFSLALFVWVGLIVPTRSAVSLG